MTGGQRPATGSWTGQLDEPTRLLLLRHGETPMSAQRRYSGRSDPELTERGAVQATAAAAALAAMQGAGRITAVLSSPLRRTRQTAEPVANALGVPLHLHEGLIETDFGDWDGLTFTEAKDADPDLHQRWLTDELLSPPGGESFAEVGRRVAAVRDEVLGSYPATGVVLVSHVTPIKILLRTALDAGPAFLFRLHLDLASLSIVDVYPDGGASVRLVNGGAGPHGAAGW